MKLKYYSETKLIFFLTMSAIAFNGCKPENNPLTGNTAELEWIIDESFIRRGCSGIDCIPSIQNPKTSSIGGENLDFLSDEELVVGIWDGENYRAYPHAILDWHEIMNEDGFSISYCPLTGSAMHFSNGGSTFGVSGLLYNSNLIMYDRETTSYWPQMFLKSAAGTNVGNSMELKPILETTWKTWKSLFPESRVVNSNTGFYRNYNYYPYGSYKSCNSSSCKDYLYFPVQKTDNRLPAKERVLTLVTDEETKVFPISLFLTPSILRESLGSHTFTIIISAEENIAIAFETDKTFSISEWNPDEGIITIRDAETGSSWNMLGLAVDGSSSGEQLKAAKGFISYWFASAAYFPTIQIYN